MTWPQALHRLTFVDGFQNLQELDVFPGALRHLAIGEMLLKCYTVTATVSSSEFQQQGVGKEAEAREFLE